MVLGMSPRFAKGGNASPALQKRVAEVVREPSGLTKTFGGARFNVPDLLSTQASRNVISVLQRSWPFQPRISESLDDFRYRICNCRGMYLPNIDGRHTQFVGPSPWDMGASREELEATSLVPKISDWKAPV